MVLTLEELIDLTGYRIASKQAAWILKYYGFEPPRKRFTGAVSISRDQLFTKKIDSISNAQPNWTS